MEVKEGLPSKREKEKRATLKWKRKVNVFVSVGKESHRLGFPLETPRSILIYKIQYVFTSQGSL